MAQEFRVAIGEMAHQAAVLESVVRIVTAGLAGLPDNLARIVLPDTTDRMLTLINRLLSERVSDLTLRAEAETWAKAVKAAHQKRGHLLHAVWVGPGDLSMHFRADLKPLTGTQESTNAQDVLAVAGELEALATSSVSQFMLRLAQNVGGPWSVY